MNACVRKSQLWMCVQRRTHSWADGHSHNTRRSNNASRRVPGAGSTDVQRTKLGLALGFIPSAGDANNSHNPRVGNLGIENAESCIFCTSSYLDTKFLEYLRGTIIRIIVP